MVGISPGGDGGLYTPPPSSGGVQVNFFLWWWSQIIIPSSDGLQVDSRWSSPAIQLEFTWSSLRQSLFIYIIYKQKKMQWSRFKPTKLNSSVIQPTRPWWQFKMMATNAKYFLFRMWPVACQMLGQTLLLLSFHHQVLVSLPPPLSSLLLLTNVNILVFWTAMSRIGSMTTS